MHKINTHERQIQVWKEGRAYEEAARKVNIVTIVSPVAVIPKESILKTAMK
jgi:hypothetical protein